MMTRRMKGHALDRIFPGDGAARQQEAFAAQGRAAAVVKLNSDRYRWLREQLRTKQTMLRAQALFWLYSSRREFDAAVDAARNEQDVAHKAP